MPTQLEEEKVNQSILDHIILGVAHEINNPNAFVRLNVTNIKKMIQLLRPCFEEFEAAHPEQKFGPYSLAELRGKLSQLLESTLGATVRIIAVADKLKQCTSFALSQSDHISLVEVVKNVVDMHRFLIEKWATCQIVCDQSDTYTIEGHKLQLEQALSILLTNASDAIAERHKESETPQGKLNITLRRIDQAICIDFSDNGTGIDDAIIAKIFAPYFTTKPQGVGDGMGLPLCQAVIERHGGKISVKSQLGVGTTFTVTLPDNVSHK